MQVKVKRRGDDTKYIAKVALFEIESSSLYYIESLGEGMEKLMLDLLLRHLLYSFNYRF